MELFTFGDSWTAGQGCNLNVENSFTDENDRRIYRNSMSWPKYLSEYLNVNVTNLSKVGSSNKEIFDTIVETIKSNIIKDNDLVIIMWSSSLRDNPLFFPNGEWHVWGKNYTNQKWKFEWVVSLIKDAIVRSNHTSNSKYNYFLKSYKEFYIDNLYDDSYYNIVNQNYILFIQKLLESYNINYVFCDAFDFMINKNITSVLDKTHFINKSNYYKFGEVTFKDFLISIDPTDSDLWEDSVKWTDTPEKHPNAKGYQKISDELYNFIINSDIIKDNKNKLIFKML
jgi:lysophospholipase L1-like esterase